MQGLKHCNKNVLIPEYPKKERLSIKQEYCISDSLYNILFFHFEKHNTTFEMCSAAPWSVGGGRANIYCFGLFHQRQFPLIKITLHVIVVLVHIFLSLCFNYHGTMYKAVKYVKNTIVL